MNFPKQHKLKSGLASYNYVHFDDVLAFNSFVDFHAQKLSHENNLTYQNMVKGTQYRINSGSTWYGTPAPTGIIDLEGHKKYLGIHLIGGVQRRIKEHLAKYLDFIDSEILPKPKLAYNDKGLGIFSFDRAGMALYKMNKIDLKKPINQVITKLNIELDKKSFQTRIKNVYAFFENKQASYPSIRLYLLAGANANINGNEMLYVGLACSELVEFLEMRNVAVEVNVLLGSNYISQTTLAVVRIKRFEDRLDKNQLLLMSSDPRYFRYRGFKALISLGNYFDFIIPEGLGRMTHSMATEFATAKGTDGFVFEQSYSLDAASKEVVTIIENYTNLLKNGKQA